MRISGTQDEIWSELTTPGMVEDLALTAHLPWRMFPYQYAAVYCLARQFNRGIILDIGTYWGRSAWTLSLAAPKAKIASLEPVRFERARQATAAIAKIKRCVNVGLYEGFERGIAEEQKAFEENITAPDVREGVTAFLDGRKPEFQGWNPEETPARGRKR